MWLSIIIFITKCGVLFSSTAHGEVRNPCHFDVKLKQTLRNEGFHRNITYGIVFSGEGDRNQWLYAGCTVGLQQLLPPGVYVNADELTDLIRNQRLTAVPKTRVNVELPKEQATDSSAYIMGAVVDNKAYLWLLVHARFARNTIPPPLVYLRCGDERLSVCDRSVSFLCNGGSRDTCTWKEVPYTLLTDPLHWDVPVGNIDHYYVVATVTIAAIVAGTMYLLRVVHQYKVKGRRKQC